MSRSKEFAGWQVDATGAARTSGTVDSTRLHVAHAVPAGKADPTGPYGAVCGTPVHQVSEGGWSPGGVEGHRLVCDATWC